MYIFIVVHFKFCVANKIFNKTCFCSNSNTLQHWTVIVWDVTVRSLSAAKYERATFQVLVVQFPVLCYPRLRAAAINYFCTPSVYWRVTACGHLKAQQPRCRPWRCMPDLWHSGNRNHFQEINKTAVHTSLLCKTGNQGPICRGWGWGFNPPNDFWPPESPSIWAPGGRF